LIYSAKGQVLFVHVSRCAGTLISNTLYQHLSDSQQIGIQHTPIAAGLPLLESEFEQLYKFCVVRNPWERLVSWYELLNKAADQGHQHSKPNRYDFGQFLDNWLGESMNVQGRTRSVQSQFAMIAGANDKVLVDHVCRFEDLQQDLSKVGERLNLTFQLSQRVNTSSFQHYSLYYNNENKAKVEDICHQDIDYFGYRFDDRQS
jgi:chondroitin 4-sulfotransferase 11